MGDRGAELHVLVIEDSETDTKLIVRELRRIGLDPRWERVDSADGLRAALARQPWQAVVSDSSVPGLTVLEALALTRGARPDVPFIAVSGTLAAETALQVIRAGAAAFVSKDDLADIGQVVVREVARARSGHDASPGDISHRLLAAQEEERRRIARGLHDQFGQLLGALRRVLEDAGKTGGEASKQKVAEGIILVDQAIQQMRDFYVVLWPVILDDLGLPAALRWLAERQARSAGLAIAVDLEEIERMPTVIEAACFWVVQEALANAARHAGATRVEVALRATEGGIEVVIRDDGRGFETEPAWERARAGASLGLLAMRERAALAGGQLEIGSTLGRGTVVSARFARGEQ